MVLELGLVAALAAQQLRWLLLLFAIQLELLSWLKTMLLHVGPSALSAGEALAQSEGRERLEV